tara:strand:- start:354 stop:2972 length:2619 start_codon:yes stop_codon:yes gene_type:complete
MSDIKQPYQKLIQNINKNTIVITSSLNLAIDIKEQYTLNKLSKLEHAWDTPKIYYWQDWLKYSFLNCNENNEYALLNDTTALNLIEKCINENLSNPLIKNQNLANHFFENMQRICDWCIPLSEIEKNSYTQEEVLFLKTLISYKEKLRNTKWIDKTSLPNHFIEFKNNFITSKNNTENYIFTGFTTITPIIERLSNQLSLICKIDFIDNLYSQVNTKKIKFDNSESEYRAAGKWARDLVSENPRKKIGIVFNNKDICKKTELIFNESFFPGWQNQLNGSTRHVKFKNSRVIKDIPYIYHTLILVSWYGQAISSKEISILLRSIYFQKNNSKGAYSLDQKIRKLPEKNWKISEILSIFNPEASQDELIILNILKDFFPMDKSKSMTKSIRNWIDIINSNLKTMNWFCDTDNSEDMNLIKDHWFGLLREIERPASIYKNISFSLFLNLMKSLAEKIKFNQTSTFQNIKLISYDDINGMIFDNLWLTGLDNQQWPKKRKLQYFIASDLVKKYGMPDSSPENTVTSQSLLLKCLSSSASDVICSYPEFRDEMRLDFTNLLPEEDGDFSDGEDPGWFYGHYCNLNGSIITIEETLPKVENLEKLKGGTSTIQLYSQDPFSSFANGRLKIAQPTEYSYGLTPLMRGTLIHNAIAILFSEKPSTYDLKHWTKDQKKKNVSIAINSSYKRISDYFKEGLAESIKFHEKRKSEIILNNLIDFFVNQSNHTIHSIEENINFTHANLLLNLKIDRVNKSPDGKLHIIDFKTGKKIKILDNKGNIKSSQLFTYAAAIKTRIESISYIFLSQDEISEEVITDQGDSNQSKQSLNIKSGINQIYSIIENIGKGDIRVNIKTHSKNEMPYRHLHVVSRIKELIQNNS